MIKVSERGMELVGSDIDLLSELAGIIHELYGQLKKHYGEAEAGKRIDYAVKLAKKDEDEITEEADRIKEKLRDIVKDVMKEMSVGG